jgi:two-component system, NarL family, sensor histidine kinase LiaS
VRQAQQELTSLIRELRPVALEGKGLALALQEYVAQWSEQTGIAAEVQVEGEQAQPLMVEQALYRIAQEALSNVTRHSKATTVQVRLACEPEATMLTIADNGQGFDTAVANGQGVGLLSMRERVQALRGEVHVKSSRGQGTTVFARVDVGV